MPKDPPSYISGTNRLGSSSVQAPRAQQAAPKPDRVSTPSRSSIQLAGSRVPIPPTRGKASSSRKHVDDMLTSMIERETRRAAQAVRDSLTASYIGAYAAAPAALGAPAARPAVPSISAAGSSTYSLADTSSTVAAAAAAAAERRLAALAAKPPPTLQEAIQFSLDLTTALCAVDLKPEAERINVDRALAALAKLEGIGTMLRKRL
jgi:hypothetical protein